MYIISFYLLIYVFLIKGILIGTQRYIESARDTN